MYNPWTELPSTAPYIHPRDVDHLFSVYDHLDKSKRPHTELLPNPVVGDPSTAKIVLLTKFPLYDPRIIEDYEDVPGYKDACRASLLFENTECPFFFIDPRFKDTVAYQWWYPKLSRLIDDCGFEAVSKGVMNVSYFPYHMQVPHMSTRPLYTQRMFTFELARAARDAGKKIVMITFGAEWQKVMRFADSMKLRSTQNLAITAENVAVGRYAELLEAIKGPAVESEVVEETETETESLEAVAV